MGGQLQRLGSVGSQVEMELGSVEIGFRDWREKIATPTLLSGCGADIHLGHPPGEWEWHKVKICACWEV